MASIKKILNLATGIFSKSAKKRFRKHGIFVITGRPGIGHSKMIAHAIKDHQKTHPGNSSYITVDDTKVNPE